MHTLFSCDGQNPDIETCQQNGANSEGQGFDCVGAVANAAVEEDRDFLLDRGGYGGERVQCCDGSVDLAASVVGDDDGVGAVVEREAGVIRMEDSLQHDRQFCLATEPTEIGLGESGVRK